MVDVPKHPPKEAASGPRTAEPISAQAPRTPAELALAFVRLVEDFQHSIYDFDRLHMMHRRNLQSLADFNQMTFDSMQSFARRQTEIMRQTTTMFSKAAVDMMQARNPAEIAQRQIATAGEAFRLAREEMTRMARLLAKGDFTPTSEASPSAGESVPPVAEPASKPTEASKVESAKQPASTPATKRPRVKPVTPSS